MNEYQRIKKRIEKKKNPFLKISTIFFALISLAIGFLIYAKNDENGSFLKKHFSLNISFEKMNNEISLFLSSLLAKFNIFTNKDSNDIKVNNEINYQKIDDYYYKTSSNKIEMLDNGKILNVKQDDDYIINVYYQNGVCASYYNLIEINVSKDDYLNKGDIIGYYEDKFKVLFSKDHELISYEEFMLS